MKSLHPAREDSYTRLINWIQQHPEALCLFVIYAFVIAWVIMLIVVANSSPDLPHYSGV